MPSCSASESDSKIRPANFQTRHKPPVRNYRRIQTEEAVCNLQTASSHHPRHSIDLGPIGSPSIRSLFRSFAGESFRAGFRAIQNTPKHRLDREADYASFPSSAATDCASSERIRTCTRSSETILLRSWIATAADCVSFSGLFSGYARSTADRRQSYLFQPGY